MSRLFQTSKPRPEQRHCEVGKRSWVSQDNQTPEFIETVKREKLRLKLAQNGEDLH